MAYNLNLLQVKLCISLCILAIFGNLEFKRLTVEVIE